MQAPVARFLARAKTAGDEEGIHRRAIRKAVVRHDGEAGLRLHGAHGIGNEESVELGGGKPLDVQDVCVQAAERR